MALYLVSFSGRLPQQAAAARAELRKWGATRLWDDVWIVDMEPAPEACLPGLVATEAALSIPLAGSEAFFSIGRAAGIAAQLTYTEKVAPLLSAPDATGAAPARVRYCNDGAAVFEPVVARYLWTRRHSVWATDLCRLMAGHGSDKGIGWHTYTPFYQSLFMDREESTAALFELGLGTNNEDTPSNMGRHGTPGASLRGWRDYFANARVYGADVDARILFAEDRIDTFFVDQTIPDTFDALWTKLPGIELDFFLDDGLHTLEAARTTFAQSIGKVRSGGYYIIEDVMKEDLDAYLDLIARQGLPGLSIDIDHAANVYDNCLVVAVAR
ncbi:hypothetical protein [Sphingomonas bacterium]|uniref:hypothetical protein n=1 Tax=Sphingomonas bacterium TaxID=1895847 RepID=UPI00157694AE|nr:hypothetical protein [Sphingomonas bacterium]